MGEAESFLGLTAMLFRPKKHYGEWGGVEALPSVPDFKEAEQ